MLESTQDLQHFSRPEVQDVIEYYPGELGTQNNYAEVIPVHQSKRQVILSIYLLILSNHIRTLENQSSPRPR